MKRVSPTVGALYGSLTSRPLRFKLTGVVASTLGVGTTLPRPGEYVRLEIEFVRVGYAF